MIQPRDAVQPRPGNKQLPSGLNRRGHDHMFMVSLLLHIISGRFVIQTPNFGYGFVGCYQILWWIINFRYNPNSQDSGIPGTFWITHDKTLNLPRKFPMKPQFLVVFHLFNAMKSPSFCGERSSLGPSGREAQSRWRWSRIWPRFLSKEGLQIDMI